MSKLLLVSAVCAGLMSCKKTDVVEVDKQFDVQDQQTVVVALPASKPKVRVTKIVDSRCPTGAQCLVAGQAAVGVALGTDADSMRTAVLYLGETLGQGATWHSRDSAAVTLAGQPYWLHLLAVNPYPSLNGSGRKSAIFRLTIR